MRKTPCLPPRHALVAIIALAPALLAPDPGDASPLDPATHGGDAPYHSDLDEPMIPLDAALPWRQRFTSEGAFDARFRLVEPETPGTPEAEHAPAHPAPHAGAFDARGVVKEVRADAGKLKIEHGPIERHGMSAMTMMFNVADPAMLEAVSPGDEVGFNLEMGPAGLTITGIERSGGTR